jgi:hypothetical protein
VASPSCGRADDKAVAAWAACGGREDRWHAVAGMLRGLHVEAGRIGGMRWLACQAQGGGWWLSHCGITVCALAGHVAMGRRGPLAHRPYPLNFSHNF